MDIHVIIWFFPILFIFHDFEEIIFMKLWINKNRRYLSKKFPKLSKKFLNHFDNITTSAFAFGVVEEFLLIGMITVISYIFNWYYIWFGLFIAFTLHLIMHLIQTIILKKYVPATATSIICLPVCIYIIKLIMPDFTLNTLILYSILGIILVSVNMIFIQKFIVIFSNWLEQLKN